MVFIPRFFQRSSSVGVNKTAGLQTSKAPAGVCFSCSKFPNIAVDFLNQICCLTFLFFEFLLIFSSRGLEVWRQLWGSAFARRRRSGRRRRGTRWRRRGGRPRRRNTGRRSGGKPPHCLSKTTRLNEEAPIVPPSMKCTPSRLLIFLP